MITQSEYEEGMRCKGLCSICNKDKDNCYQYAMSNVLIKNVYYKEVKYKCTIYIKTLKINVEDENFNVIYSDKIVGQTLIEACEIAVKKAYEKQVKEKDYNDFVSWDGIIKE